MTSAPANMTDKARRKDFAAIVLLLLFATIYITQFLKTQNDWWFEDDPVIYLLSATKVANPLAFFYDKDLRISLGLTNEMIPMQHLSFWIDAQIAPFSVKIAYLHNIILFMLTAGALYVFARRLLKSASVAAILVAIWMCLPSTIATHEFLSARCYMEGLLYSVLAVLMTQNLINNPKSKNRGWWRALTGLFCLLATLSKEFYPTSTLAFVFLLLLFNRAYRELAIPVAVGLFYAVFRLYMLKFDLTYGHTPLSVAEYLTFLGKIPFIFAGGFGGYAIFAAVVLIALISTTMRQNKWLYAFIVVNILIALLTIFPVSDALDLRWKTFGTWYRSPFVLNTVLLFSGAVIAAVSKHKKYAVPVYLILLLTIIPSGSEETRRAWNTMKKQNKANGEFIVDHPDKILFANEPAKWFLPGVAALYQAQKFDTGLFIDCNDYMNHLESIEAATSIWTYHDDKVIEVPELRSMLLSQSPHVDYCAGKEH